MVFRYETTQDREFAAELPLEAGAAAGRTVCLVKTLNKWFGQPPRIYHRDGTDQLQVDYEVLSVPTMEFAQNVGAVPGAISREWPAQAFALADDNELIGLSFLERGGRSIVRQKNISGARCEALNGCCLVIRLPDERAAACMRRLLEAATRNEPAVALPWEDADFLKRQRLCAPDPTLSFCYVSLDAGAPRSGPAACLSGLLPGQKETLWLMFLEKHLRPLEFEWLRDALAENRVPRWIGWQLALYRVLERLGIRFVCKGEQFELTDRDGRRLYYGVDHTNAAEQVLMKILFPLNA